MNEEASKTLTSEEIQQIVQKSFETQALAQSVKTPEQIAEEMETMQNIEDFQNLQENYMLVMCRYVPWIFVILLILFASVIFKFFYKILSKHFSNFV